MAGEFRLGTVDYVIAGLVLWAPLAIGVLFAVKDRKRATREEYLVGGRRMSLIPVTLSLFVTFQSAISLMGIPSDIYTYGAMASLLYIGFCISYVVGYFTVVPVIYPLKLTSMYEYLNLRYQSQMVRMAATVVGMIQTTFYMAIALLSPALALQAAAAIPLWMSLVIVGFTGTIYTALGGIKSVVWTDTFQTVVLLIGVITVIVKGCLKTGGLREAMSLARQGGRASFDVLDPDPRTRHTWWGMVFGGLFNWLINVFNQSSVQRVSSMRSLRDAKLSFLISIPIHLAYGSLLLMVGLVMYAYFHHVRCDPVQDGRVINRNQLLPFYALHALQDLPGMPGLFMAAVFSGCLSTISSGINALAANTVEDVLKQRLRAVSEKRATQLTKVIVLLYGTLILGLAYSASSLSGPVTQMTLTVVGGFGSPVLGMFLMGCLVPVANKYGAIAGGVVSLVFNVSLGIGNRFYGRKAQTLPPASMESCSRYNSTYLYGNMANTSYDTTLQVPTMETLNPGFTSSLGINESLISTVSSIGNGATSSYGFFLTDISYEWYGLIGTVISVTVSLVVSVLTRRYVQRPPHPALIAPFCRSIWYRSPPVQTDKPTGSPLLTDSHAGTKFTGNKTFQFTVSPPADAVALETESFIAETKHM